MRASHVVSLVIGAALVLAACSARAARAQNPPPAAAHPLIATWRFVRYETWDRAGVRSTPFGTPPSGYIAFDSNGIALVQLSAISPASDSTAAQTVNFGAYYGRYTVDPKADTIRIAVEGANFDGYIGTVQVRPFRLSGDTLYLGVPGQYQATLVRVNGKRRTP
jgi:hypothetical protein